jgi:glycosyltransferase involved in cell wall biosynthesis
MKIAMISKADSSGGGASKVATQLTQLLRNEKINVDHFTRSVSTSTDTIPLYTDFEKKIYHRLLDLGVQEYFPFERKVLKKYDALKHYDIFHFHDITSAVSPLTLKYLSDQGKKIVWTIHDCSVFTGGCINPLECRQYLSLCKRCPQLNSFGLGRNLDFTSIFHRIKKYVLQNSNIHFVAPSKWIADMAYETGYLQEYPTIIHNGIDTDVFKPHNKKALREELKLPQERFIILFSAATLANPYKGFQEALLVLKKLQNVHPFLLFVGKDEQALQKYLKNFDFLSTGYIQDSYLLNKYYASADIYLNTTLADNFPLTALEVMASGTPNFGFETGGMKEMVTNNFNGFLVKYDKRHILADQIIQYSKEQNNQLFEMNTANTMKKHFSLIALVEKYKNLYTKILTQ